jgi:putative Ca2+/H+ antiporter (TMEM165/GDT1 family)
MMQIRPPGDAMTAAQILFATFGSVLLAEFAGDRSLYAIVSITARFRPVPVLIGVIPAYALKMFAAVLVASAVSHLSPWSVATISSITWLLAAWAVWRRETNADRNSAFARLRHPSVVAFVSIAFTEWGDPGQLAAAGLAARFHAPLFVWGGATAALITKALVALMIGVAASRYIGMAWLRIAATLFCLVNAAMAVLLQIGAVG